MTMTIKQFNKGVENLAKDTKTIADKIHSFSMFALEQCNVHGNTDPMNKLIGALHHSQRKQALVAWFKDLSLAVMQEDKTFKYSKGKTIALITSEGDKVEYSPTDAIVYADDHPYYDYTVESKPPSSFDMLKAIEALIKRASKYTEEGKTVEHLELKAALEALVPAEAK